MSDRNAYAMSPEIASRIEDAGVIAVLEIERLNHAVPVGGLNITNVSNYLKSPLVCALGGSWLAKRDLIREEKWDAIAENAGEIRKMINESRGQE